MPPIHEAAHRGDLAEVTRLLREVPILVHTIDENFDSPLLLAAKAGHLEIVDHLLDRGARVNERCRYYQGMPLYWACRHGHLEVVKLLVERGADPSLSDGAKETPLFAASMAGHVEVVAFLVAQKATCLDAVDNLRQTSLYRATVYGHADVVRVLLEAGADPTIPNDKGTTPMALARRHARQRGHQGCVELLEVTRRHC